MTNVKRRWLDLRHLQGHCWWVSLTRSQRGSCRMPVHFLCWTGSWQKKPKMPCFLVWGWKKNQASPLFHCGNCNFVLSHTHTTKNPPNKQQCPSLFGLLSLRACKACGLLLNVVFSSAAGCYDYKLASVLIRFQALKKSEFKTETNI